MSRGLQAGLRQRASRATGSPQGDAIQVCALGSDAAAAASCGALVAAVACVGRHGHCQPVCAEVSSIASTDILAFPCHT
jgi:hypothetical protein